MPFSSDFYASFIETLNKVRQSFFDFLLSTSFKIKETFARQPFTYIFKTQEANEHLRATQLINYENESVRSTAGILIQPTKFDTIMKMGNYVIAKLEYNKKTMELDWEERTASEVLKRKQGVCADAAVLLVALLRAANIPARLVTGKIRGEAQGYHAWVQVYYDRKWLHIDPTNWKGMNKEWASEGVQGMIQKNYMQFDIANDTGKDVFVISGWDIIQW